MPEAILHRYQYVGHGVVVEVEGTGPPGNRIESVTVACPEAEAKDFRVTTHLKDHATYLETGDLLDIYYGGPESGAWRTYIYELTDTTLEDVRERVELRSA